LVTAAALPATLQVTSAADMARALEPLLGRWAGAFFACGLLAAGLSSAITAPLAAAYATCGVMGWDTDLSSWSARAVWMPVLAVGVVFSALALANDRSLLGSRANGRASNLLGTTMVLVAAALGLRSLLRAVAGL
jgi:Mn2+/Fe2+ NRAMP family transporter